MSDLSFDIKTSEDLFKILLKNYNEFCADRTSSRHALHCAIIAWHLVEWTYKERKSQIEEHLRNEESYRKNLIDSCPSLEIMRNIANGTKHNKQEGESKLIKRTELHRGVFSKEFSREFNTSHLKIVLHEGSKIYFEDEIKKVVSFWNEYLHPIPNLSQNE